MKAWIVDRPDLDPDFLAGKLLCRDVAVDGGVVRKGTPLGSDEIQRLQAASWNRLHLAELEAGEILEGPAGERIARAVAADQVEVGSFAGGYWPVTARVRGLVRVARDRLLAVNRIDGVAVCTLLDGHVVDAGELVARVKVVPFAIQGSEIQSAEREAGGGTLSVRPFPGRRVGVLAMGPLPEKAVVRFEGSLSDKLSWLGSEVVAFAYPGDEVAAVEAALRSLLDRGAELILAAGSKAMDPSDATLQALDTVGARLVKRGAPVFPGTLLWLARWADVPIAGLPSCGIFSKATVVDLLLPRLLIGDPLDHEAIAALGHGGLLRPESAFAIPGYAEGRRGLGATASESPRR